MQENEQVALTELRKQGCSSQLNILQFRTSQMQALFLVYLSSLNHNSAKLYFKEIYNLFNSRRLSRKQGQFLCLYQK